VFFFDFGVDGAGDFVVWQQFWWPFVVVWVGVLVVCFFFGVGVLGVEYVGDVFEYESFVFVVV